MKRAVLITGLIRDAANFLSLLDVLSRARADGHEFDIVFSTWTGELDRYPDLKPVLRGLGVVVVRQDPPNLKLTGHMLHQVLAIEMGLSLLPHDTFVLKVRPDMSHASDVAAFFEIEDSFHAVADGYLDSFRFFSAPISIVSFSASNAFYINDITFSGMQRDLIRFCQLSFVTLVKFTRVAPEQLLWSSAFIGENFLFERVWRANVGLVFNEKDVSLRLHSNQANSGIWISHLAEYYNVLAANFIFLNHSRNLLTDVEVLSTFRLEDLLWSPISAPWVQHLAAASTNAFMSMSAMEVVRRGAFAKSEFGDKFCAEVCKSRGAYVEQRSISELEEEVRLLGFAIETDVGVLGMRCIRKGDEDLEVLGLGPAWTFLDVPVPAVEAELNLLRRTIDKLNLKLSQLAVSEQQG
jgi:hypothetical protein